MSTIPGITTNPSTIPSIAAPPGPGSASAAGLDKNAFLKLLVTQLQNQDPTQPMQDTAFIAQMAQFSSLEQMTNVSGAVGNLVQSQNATESLALAGRTVDLNDPQAGAVTGKVDEVRLGSDGPKLVVAGKTYSLAEVVAVH